MNPYERYKGFTEGPWKLLIVGDDYTPTIFSESSMVSEISEDCSDGDELLIVSAPLLLQDCREMWESLHTIREAVASLRISVDDALDHIDNLFNRIKERHNG